jgi:hippurate hydrolase
MKDQIKALADKHFDNIVNIRKYLHANPELSFKEYETSKYIQQFLTDNNIEFQAGFVETGIVAHIKGKNPDKKIIALRTDIDALPINETNDVE